MIKKSLKIILICVIVLVIGYFAMLSIDRNRVFSNEAPLNVINIENSANDFEISFEQRKDLGIEEIVNLGSDLYSIKTFGGDAFILINGVNYRLEEAIENKIINTEDIFTQVQKDYENEICTIAVANDGGSTEYYYDNFTVLKLSTLDGENDLIIGMKGPILDLYNKNK